MSHRILYDVSQLGLPWYLPAGQSYGLARMTAQLLPRLLNDEDSTVRALALDHPIECARLMERDFPELSSRLANRPPGALERTLTDHLARHYHGEARPAIWPRTLRKLLRAYQGRRRSRDAMLQTALGEASLLHHEIAVSFDCEAFPQLRTLVTVHDLIPIRHPEWGGDGEALAARLRQAERQQAHFICVSEHVRADLIDYLDIDAERVLVLHQAADRGVFFPSRDTAAQTALRRKYPALPEGGRYFFSLSSFTARKNIGVLIEAFSATLAARPDDEDLCLVLGGYLNRQQQASILALAPSAAVRERVRILDGIDDADFAPLLSGALGFVFLSLAEGFGLPPLEAMMCGAPVICSTATSLPEVVGDAALSVDPADAASAAGAMQQVASDPALRADLSARSLERAAQFSWDRCAEDVKAAYVTVLGRE